MLRFRVATDGKLDCTTSSDGISWLLSSSTTSFNVANEWQHVAVTVDGSTTTAIFYLDGVSATNAGVDPAATIADKSIAYAWIGKTNNGDFFTGEMADVAVWDSVLTQAQIREVAAEGGLSFGPSTFIRTATYIGPN